MKQTEIEFANKSSNIVDPSVGALIEQLTASGDYKVIRRLHPVERYCADNDKAKKTAIYLDTETTGMELEKDRIIELAMVPFEYDEDGNIYRVLPEYDALQDPKMTIPDHIIKITHITNEMVKGQSIDWTKVTEMLTQADLVIAHNARFDRPFVEKYLDDFQNIPWACSMMDVDWNDEGFEGVKLEYLAYKYGFFYEGHRANIDCQAGIELLSQTLPITGETAMKRLVDNAGRTIFRLWARGAPFDKKNLLRKRGYRWSPGEDGKPKAWYCDLLEDQIDDEMVYLNENVYPLNVKTLPTDRITAMDRYSKRG